MKLWATIQKDIRILLRDRAGLILMFAMPVLLVIVVTAIQNSTFDITHKNRLSLLVCNKDTGNISKEYVATLDTSGLFNISFNNNITEQQLADSIYKKNMAGCIIIDNGFSQQVEANSKQKLPAFLLQPCVATIAETFHPGCCSKFITNNRKQGSIKAVVFLIE